jgi:hypothetical protein
MTDLQAKRAVWMLLLLLLLLVACGDEAGTSQSATSTVAPAEATRASRLADPSAARPGTPEAVSLDLTLTEEDVSIAPLPVRAGFPLSVTAIIHNNSLEPAADVPVMIHLSAKQEKIGYMPFLQVLTVTVPASQSVEVELPVNWNLAGGEHELWVQVNRLPEAWQSRVPTLPEEDISDNIVLVDLMVDPFDAYSSALCPGRVDVEIGPADVLPEPERQRVLVRVHNVGNRAVYNLPVVALGDHVSGITYTPAIPPCGGTTEVYVETDQAFEEGESLIVQVNPSEWPDGLLEDDFDNNQVTVSGGLAPGMVVPPGSGLDDYDFSITTADIEIPELWITLVTVHNLGTRDAAMVPIRIENEAGRSLTDAVPLVQGNGMGVAAVRVGYLWTHGGTLTFTVNPEDAKDPYPETNRDNNIATFTLP